MENDENQFLEEENYKLPEQKEVILDVQGDSATIKDIKDLAPIEMIRITAKEQGITLKEFKDKRDFKYKKNFFDSGCRNKGCWGRGYIGWEGNIPIPCKCLFLPENRDFNKKVLNRKANRDLNKMARDQARNDILNQAEVYGLKNLDKDIWVSKNGAKFEWSNIKGKWDFRRI